MSKGPIVERLIAGVAANAVGPATLSSDPEGYDVAWAVIAKRARKGLLVHLSPEPTTFAALAHARPTFTVSPVEAGQEVAVLKAAAERLPLPADGRALPFVLLRAQEQEVCGVAFPTPLPAVAVLVGHARGALVPLEAVVGGEREVAAVGLDSNSSRFGVTSLRRPTSELRRIDLDDGSLALAFDGLEAEWRLSAPVTQAQQAAVGSLATRLGIALRRLVQVDANTRAFQVVDDAS